MKITKAQQKALLRIVANSGNPKIEYKALRRKAQPTFGMDSAIVVHCWGMWLAIETDGYTHS